MTGGRWNAYSCNLWDADVSDDTLSQERKLGCRALLTPGGVMVLALEKEQLRGDEMGAVVVDHPAEELDAVAEQPRVGEIAQTVAGLDQAQVPSITKRLTSAVTLW